MSFTPWIPCWQKDNIAKVGSSDGSVVEPQDEVGMDGNIYFWHVTATKWFTQYKATIVFSPYIKAKLWYTCFQKPPVREHHMLNAAFSQIRIETQLRLQKAYCQATPCQDTSPYPIPPPWNLTLHSSLSHAARPITTILTPES